jgi:serralysin
MKKKIFRVFLIFGIIIFFSVVFKYKTIASYQYTSMNGQVFKLYPYSGRNIALLIPSSNLDQTTIEKIITVFDEAFDYYFYITKRLPEKLLNYNNLATIAVVPETCGAGCGYLGATGIEITEPTFKILYDGVQNYNHYDQVVFYELGRNFWFYGDKAEYKGLDNTGSITTGYAVFMRFMSIDATKVTPGPFNNNDFPFFRNEVEGLIKLYLADSSQNWQNTLRVGRAPQNTLNLGATDLFASVLFQLKNLYGEEFLIRLWKELANRPMAASTQDAVDNFIVSASLAASENLSTLFTQTWRWPLSKKANDELISKLGI